MALAHHLESDLGDLKQRLLVMASRAEDAVTNAVKAVVERNYDLAVQVRENDAELDRFEMEIDDAAIYLLSKAPLASDLRLITVAMKISQNLERIGDEAAKISNRAKELSQEIPLKQVNRMPGMAAMAVAMLRAALDAFVNHDPAAARSLIPRDKEVDALNKDIHRELAQQIIQDPSTVSRCLNLMVVSKSLERIADHATNVAEEVVYLYEARDIRHTGKRTVPPEGTAQDKAA